jgi:hypothetical protein
MTLKETVLIRDITDTCSKKTIEYEVPVKKIHAEYFENILKY